MYKILLAIYLIGGCKSHLQLNCSNNKSIRLSTKLNKNKIAKSKNKNIFNIEDIFNHIGQFLFYKDFAKLSHSCKEIKKMVYRSPYWSNKTKSMVRFDFLLQATPCICEIERYCDSSCKKCTEADKGTYKQQPGFIPEYLKHVMLNFLTICESCSLEEYHCEYCIAPCQIIWNKRNIYKYLSSISINDFHAIIFQEFKTSLFNLKELNLNTLTHYDDYGFNGIKASTFPNLEKLRLRVGIIDEFREQFYTLTHLKLKSLIIHIINFDFYKPIKELELLPQHSNLKQSLEYFQISFGNFIPRFIYYRDIITYFDNLKICYIDEFFVEKYDDFEDIYTGKCKYVRELIMSQFFYKKELTIKNIISIFPNIEHLKLILNEKTIYDWQDERYSNLYFKIPNINSLKTIKLEHGKKSVVLKRNYFNIYVLEGFISNGDNKLKFIPNNNLYIHDIVKQYGKLITNHNRKN